MADTMQSILAALFAPTNNMADVDRLRAAPGNPPGADYLQYLNAMQGTGYPGVPDTTPMTEELATQLRLRQHFLDNHDPTQNAFHSDYGRGPTVMNANNPAAAAYRGYR